ncbi:MAG: acyl-CoA dehydrogenase [Cyclonatronaceae bacterium]
METLLVGFLTEQPVWAVIVVAVIVLLALGYTGALLLVWFAAAAVLLLGYSAPVWTFYVLGVLAILLLIKPVRRSVLSAGIMKLMTALKFLPVISETERTAIEAGTVWVDGELFSGKPDFKKILKENYPDLTTEEQKFIDGPVEELCRMTNDWDVFQRRDLPPEVWEYLKKERFFGLIIPKKYGGHGFSALANSTVVAKLSSRCGPLSTTVMVPNSLGPAELLIHYGTEAQKDHYLPRLARGEDIPCFALTEPNAGSDAGAIESNGVVFRDENGKLFLKLNWEKRYITLAAISTVLGLAFKLRDPDNLLGKGTNPGITCALIPSDTPGVKLGLRHDPLGVPFVNCPTFGHDVVVPVDSIIGGVDGAGKGWRMLMESLAAGRGISLPASSAGGIKSVMRVAGAYAAVRKQFGVQIGRFEGIEEPLARIGGYAYIYEAARKFTCGGLDKGAKPAVVTAIAKYNFTEAMRKAINDGMDILGGSAISRGPKNLLANGYLGVPISITVEGANILTRTLMIFGQGAIRCHPYAFKEIDALTRGDLRQFDEAFWKHIGHVGRNKARAFLLSLTRGRLAGSPVGGPAARYFKKMSWTSASFAFTADIALGAFGGGLKLREKLTGRFADILSWMYLGTAVLRRFEAEGRPKEDEPFLHWSMQYCFAQIQGAFDGIYRHMDVPVLGWFFKGPMLWWSRINPIGSMPSDRLGSKVARAMQVPGDQRDRLTEGVYLPDPDDMNEPLSILENAFRLTVQSDAVARKIRDAVKSGKLSKEAPSKLLKKAVAAGVISENEADLVARTEKARSVAVAVDSFTMEEYKKTAMPEAMGQTSKEDIAGVKA